MENINKKIKEIELIGRATFEKSDFNPTTKILADDILDFCITGIQKEIYYLSGELTCYSVFDSFEISIEKSKVNRKQIETILKPSFNIRTIKIIYEDGSVDIYKHSINSFEQEVYDYGEEVEISIETD